MIKEAIEFLFDAGVRSQTSARDNHKVIQIRPGLYANQEGSLADQLNSHIEQRERKVADVDRCDQASDVASFVALVARHKTDTTEVFVGENTAVAVLAMDGWRRHTITLPLERSYSWNFWGFSASRPAAEVADHVAAFVDDVAGDGVSGETLLQCLSGLDWVSDESTRMQHTATGLKIVHKSEDRVVELPGRFEVQVPVYQFEDRVYEMPIRLTARRMNGTRAIVFTPIGASKVERRARGLLVNDIRAGLEGVPVHSGAPCLSLGE